MEYFLGSLITVGMFFAYKYLFKNKHNDIKFYQSQALSQSYIHNMLFPFLPSNKELAKMFPRKTQAVLHNANQYIKILFFENKAYWIKDSVFWVADTEDGKVVEDSVKKVDTMAMDKVELDKMSFIVSKLTEGFNDDNSTPRI